MPERTKIYRLTIRGSYKSHCVSGITIRSLSERRHIYYTDAKRLSRRSDSYAGADDDGVRGGDAILADILRYGPQNVSIALVEECTPAEAEALKEFWIDYFRTWEPDGYNQRRLEKEGAS